MNRLQKILSCFTLSILQSGCAYLTTPPKITDYQGPDYAMIRAEDSGFLYILSTYIEENGCYKSIKKQTLTEATWNKPDNQKLIFYKIKANEKYQVTFFHATHMGNQEYLIPEYHSFIPERGHSYNEDGIYDLTSNKYSETWPLDKRCFNDD